MRYIQSQTFLVAFVLTGVFLANLAQPGGGQQPQPTPVGQGYVAPAVPPGNQLGFIYLLQVDRSIASKNAASRRVGCDESSKLSIQSYNAIAGQMNARLLQQYGLPPSLR
jgi:hypothetical protein